MAEKVNHHFIPQFYLRAFSSGGAPRQAQVFTFDNGTRRTFRTHVRNVGSRRNFNRVEIDGIDPNFIEDGMAEVEAEISNHLREVVEARGFPSHDHFVSVLNLIATVSVRNPRFRGVLDELHQQIVNRTMSLLLASKDRWEGQVEAARNNGVPIKDNVTYEDIRSFHESGAIDVVIDQTYLINLEMQSIEPVLRACASRNWCFASAPEGADFITSDDPVVLTWLDGTVRGPYSPGHGLQGTILTFSLTPQLALVGAFKDIPKRLDYTKAQAVALNTGVARQATKQIYARDGSFMVHLKDRSYVTGDELPIYFPGK